MKTELQHQLECCNGNLDAIALTHRIAELQEWLERKNEMAPRVIAGIQSLALQRRIILEQEAAVRRN